MTMTKDQIADTLLEAMAQCALQFTPEHIAPAMLADGLDTIRARDGRDAFALIAWVTSPTNIELRIKVEPSFRLDTYGKVEFGFWRGGSELRATAEVGWPSCGTMSPAHACGLAAQHAEVATRVARCEAILADARRRFADAHPNSVRAALRIIDRQAVATRARVLGIKLSEGGDAPAPAPTPAIEA